METIKLLKKLYKELGTWHDVARELGISYSYICMLRNGRKPGAFLYHVIEDTVRLKGL
jgi:predicted transcriptional regulator